MPQASTSVYGVRTYHNQSILAPHVDRLPLVSSAIINVAQDVDEDWLLEVYDHQGVGMSRVVLRTRWIFRRLVSRAPRTILFHFRLAHNVTMEPGDLGRLDCLRARRSLLLDAFSDFIFHVTVLYESHSVIHGRPFRLNGRFYSNIFVHFEPLGLPLNMPDSEHSATNHDYNTDLPPYVIPGSVWESEYRNSFPGGWSLMKDVFAIVQRGDLTTFRYLTNLNSAKAYETDGTSAEWRPIHEAARSGHKEILQFLIEEHKVDVNQLCSVGGGTTPLSLVHEYFGADHEASLYLASVGGIVLPEPSGNVNESVHEHDEHPEEWDGEEDEYAEGYEEYEEEDEL
jgi:prolyl 4-hydroxylase